MQESGQHVLKFYTYFKYECSNWLWKHFKWASGWHYPLAIRKNCMFAHIQFFYEWTPCIWIIEVWSLLLLLLLLFSKIILLQYFILSKTFDCMFFFITEPKKCIARFTKINIMLNIKIVLFISYLCTLILRAFRLSYMQQ